jgi:hypothetical protein
MSSAVPSTPSKPALVEAGSARCERGSMPPVSARWQVPHATVRDEDSCSSQNSVLPRLALAVVTGLPIGVGMGGSGVSGGGGGGAWASATIGATSKSALRARNTGRAFMTSSRDRVQQGWRLGQSGPGEAPGVGRTSVGTEDPLPSTRKSWSRQSEASERNGQLFPSQAVTSRHLKHCARRRATSGEPTGTLGSARLSEVGHALVGVRRHSSPPPRPDAPPKTQTPPPRGPGGGVRGSAMTRLTSGPSDRAGPRTPTSVG